MILVDTSVLIDFFKGKVNYKTELFEEVLEQDIPFGISPYTFQEIIQGSRDEPEFNKLKSYLSTQMFYFLPQSIDTYEKAARLFFELRRNGKTIRSTIDILIALTAIENNLILLHNDRDFDVISDLFDSLKTLKNI